MVQHLGFLKTVVHDRGKRSLAVEPATDGWHVSERESGQLVQQQQYTDWHRVERRVIRFMRDIRDLPGARWIQA